MAPPKCFILWLHGLGDSGPANQAIANVFTSPELSTARWSFPTAPSNPVTCNNGAVMPSWFDIYDIPVGPDLKKDEKGLLKAVEDVHAIIDKEVAVGVDPRNIFICGLSQGGALTLASVLLYPRTLGGGAVFSGWLPFGSSIARRISSEAKKTPILWVHGKIDRIVLFSAAQAGIPFLRKARIRCEFKVYEGLGHTITNEELEYLESWIKQALRDPSPTDDEDTKKSHWGTNKKKSFLCSILFVG